MTVRRVAVGACLLVAAVAFIAAPLAAGHAVPLWHCPVSSITGLAGCGFAGGKRV